MDWSLMWAIRCHHEAQMHERSCFVTLTYDDEHLPPGGLLERSRYKWFLRRLVKRLGVPCRFFFGGEYGAGARPHYHGLLFGVDFDDRVLHSKRGDNLLYRSPLLEELWPLGFSSVGSVSFESAAYVARYCLKKSGVTLPGQFVRMSRRPGLGSSWLQKYASDAFPRGYVVIGGKEVKAPRFYDNWFKALRPWDFEMVRRRRMAAALERGPVVPARLRASEIILKGRVDKLERNL